MIQQFIDQGLILNPEVSTGGFVYNEDHIFRYFGAIFLRNSGHPMKQIIKIIQSYDTEDIKEKIIGSISDNKVTKNKFDNQIDYLKIDTNLSEKLKKLGRLEGRVLRSQWIRFAITSWFNVEVKKKELKSLSEEDIDTLCWAFMVSLRETVGLSKSNKLDRKIS